METTSRNRRQVLTAGATGALGLLAAAAISPVSTRAATGDPLVLGASNEADARTSLDVAGEDGLYVTSDKAFGRAVYGYASGSGFANGIYGESANGTGVFGDGPRGVVGRNGDNGIGVQGMGANGSGVYATSIYGPGLEASSENASGVVVFLQAGNTSPGVLAGTHEPAGYSLETQGRIRLSTSGVATVAAATDRVRVTPGFAITASTTVLATLQSDPGTLGIRYVSTDPGTASFTVVLTGKTRVAIRVAYLALG